MVRILFRETQSALFKISLTFIVPMRIIILNTLKRRVKCDNMTEKGAGIQKVLFWLNGVIELAVSGWKHLHGKHLKTTSEWPSSGPVTPLSSE